MGSDALGFDLRHTPNDYTAEDIAPPPEDWPDGAVGVEVENPAATTLVSALVSEWTPRGDAGFGMFVKQAGAEEPPGEGPYPASVYDPRVAHAAAGARPADLDVAAMEALEPLWGSHDLTLYPRVWFVWTGGFPGNYAGDVETWLARPFFHVALRWQTSRYRFVYPDQPPPPGRGRAIPLRTKQRTDGLANSTAARHKQRDSRQGSLRIGSDAYL